MFRQ